MKMSEHRTRISIENNLTEIKENKSSPATQDLFLVECELLLDIRDLLYDIARNSGILKWGAKI